MASTNTENYPTHLYSVPYSTLSSLNTLDLHFPSDSPEPSSQDTKYWIIYLHGGAYRDPLVTSASILPTLPFLSPQVHPIAAIASVNYRLSAYSDHTTQPSLPSDASRSAIHPDHIHDVLTAIAWLQNKYGFGERYVLAGHSVGATLAWQVVMGSWGGTGDDSGLTTPAKSAAVSDKPIISLPLALLSLCGIHSFPLLASTFSHIPIYRAFITGALGSDEKIWEKVSPTAGLYDQTWSGGKVSVIAASKGDGLVDWGQVGVMAEVLEKEKTGQRKDEIVEIVGQHNEVWEKGAEVARAIGVTLKLLVG